MNTLAINNSNKMNNRFKSTRVIKKIINVTLETKYFLSNTLCIFRILIVQSIYQGFIHNNK